LKEEKLFYLLALLKVDGIGDVSAKKLISQCGSATHVFKEKKSTLLKISGVGESIINKLKDESLFKRAEKELNFIQTNNITTTTFYDVAYPQLLKHCFDAPLVLFKKGKINFGEQKVISIVGTRQMTRYGKKVLEDLFEDLKDFNPIIVSGLAYGVDIYAHQLAIKHNFQTVAVLAHGLDRIYPAVHKKDAIKMQENGGLLTDFWSGSRPDRENFVKRNRIVAGLSQATILIESAEKGGSLITADIANSYNRDVFAVPGRISDKYSIGCNNLIKTNRASVFTSAKDLVYILNWEKETNKTQKAIQKQLFVALSDQEKIIYNYLLKEGKQQLDVIALHCNFPIHKTASVLLNLELKSLTRPLPGKLFEAI
jgi:DNA processing protein